MNKKYFLLLSFALCLVSCIYNFSNTSFYHAEDDDTYLRPSIYNKGAPTVVDDGTTDDGEKIVAKVVHYDDEGREVVDLVTDKNMVVTSYIDRTNIDDTARLTSEQKVTIKDSLEVAYEEINAKIPVRSLKNTLDEIAKTYNQYYNETVYTFTDLFDLTLSTYYDEEVLSDPNFYLEVTFAGQYNKYEDKPVFIHRPEETGEWEIADYDKVEVNNEDGSVTVRFRSLCPVAILVVNEIKGQELIDNGEKNANRCYFIYPVIGVLVGYAIYYALYLIADSIDEEKYEENKDKVSYKFLSVIKKDLTYYIATTLFTITQIVLSVFCLIHAFNFICYLLLGINIVMLCISIIYFVIRHKNGHKENA